MTDPTTTPTTTPTPADARERAGRALYEHRQATNGYPPDGYTAWDDLPEEWQDEYREAADAALAAVSAAAPESPENPCAACGKPRREHRSGYSAYRCTFRAAASPDEREALARAFAEHHARKVVYAIDYEHADVALAVVGQGVTAEQAWDEGATKASPYGGAYLRSILIQNPYRVRSGEQGCNCGFGGAHDPANPRCRVNDPTEAWIASAADEGERTGR